MSDVYHDAAVDAFWVRKVADMTIICMDCLRTPIEIGDHFYLMLGQLSYDPKSRPIPAHKPVCKSCFNSRRELLGALLQASA